MTIKKMLSNIGMITSISGNEVIKIDVINEGSDISTSFYLPLRHILQVSWNPEDSSLDFETISGEEYSTGLDWKDLENHSPESIIAEFDKLLFNAYSGANLCSNYYVFWRQ